LSEESSKHVVQVLRMGVGDRLQLTDGLGVLANATIRDDHKKKCAVIIEDSHLQPAPVIQTIIAISLLKNSTRFEWFLEKAAELGVHEIVPLICARTEKQHFRTARMHSILTSAMLQSNQVWLTRLREPLAFNHFIEIQSSVNESGMPDKFIAHCEDSGKSGLVVRIDHAVKKRLILIGPEGDFSPAEIQLAVDNNFIPVQLGQTRLRTETAGVIAATLLQLV
jgi:16S rRNA (uracil1498-N3)-methyltransferase